MITSLLSKCCCRRDGTHLEDIGKNCQSIVSTLSPPAHFNFQNGNLCESSMKDICVSVCLEEGDSSNCNLKLQC